MSVGSRSIVIGALAGALGGAIASFAMNQFQAAISDPAPSAEKDDPATVKAAERLVGRPLDEPDKEPAGNAVHYGFGVTVGALYGAVAALDRRVAAGFGLPFGVIVALIADEVLVPVAQLSAAPWRLPARTHAYAIASHLVFGATLEAVRRIATRAP